MASSLGIYVDDLMIKYAKVSKEKDSIKVVSFNTIFYDNLGQAIEQIIKETNSYKIPISINLSDEMYGYIDVFSQLKKSDIKNTVDIEFEMECNEKGYSKSDFVMQFLTTPNREDRDKLKALYIATKKDKIMDTTKNLGQYKLQNVSPITTSITNLVEVDEKSNVIIVNMEDITKITTVIDGTISKIDILDCGMKDILNEINKTENSMAKSYEVCKNITIYTQDMQAVQGDENEHLEDVMPTLYKVVTEVKKIIDSSIDTISQVYVTGSAVAINNIDLYFQEYIVNAKCSLLRPFFFEGESLKLSVKDYLEVNSAVALALNNLGYGIKEINFANSAINADTIAKLKSMFKGEPGKGIDMNMSGALEPIEKFMIRGIVVSIILIAGFTAFSKYTMQQISEQQAKVESAISKTNIELSKIDSDTQKINTQTTTYNQLIASLQQKSSEKTDDSNVYRRIIKKDAVPNLLTRIMTKIPQKVKITSIENTEEDHIVIQAEASQYEQLGFFKGLITTERILENVKSTSGVKENEIVKVTIEGDIP